MIKIINRLICGGLLVSGLLLPLTSAAKLPKQTLLTIDDEELIESSIGPIAPYGLLKLSDKVRYIFWFAMEKGQLFLIEKDQQEYKTLNIFDISIGKKGYDKLFEGDKKTPVGLYYFDRFIDDSRLNDFYGIGAFPINYPNEFDVFRNRTGSGIWLHGLPKGVKSRPLRDSDGCMVVANDKLETLKQYILPGQTIVILQDHFKWGSVVKSVSLTKEIEARIEDWRSQWSALNTEEYLQYYSSRFDNTQKNFRQWKKHKLRVNSRKKWIDVQISEVNLVLYPGTNDLIQAQFKQSYRSSNYRSEGYKKQLWQKEDDGQWRVIFESTK